jgi:GNAT superfamily N-acetyltransferase
VVRLSGPEPISSAHRTEGFDCGDSELNEWLRRHALASQSGGGARTLVVHRADAVVGYVALAAGSVEPERAPDRVRRALGRHPIPVIVLARLAVDVQEQGHGLGAHLLREALLRALAASEHIGARAVMVHAKDADTRAFYEHHEFTALPNDELHLFLLMKDIRRLVR